MPLPIELTTPPVTKINLVTRSPANPSQLRRLTQGVSPRAVGALGLGDYTSPVHEITEEQIRVRYGETDQMGHAYYANYLYWFEQARGAWCRARGFTYKGLEEMGFMLPVVEVHVRYRGEVKYDDVITVRVWLAEVRRASLNFRYEIVNLTTGKVTTEGYTWHVLMGSSRKAVSMPPEVKELLTRPPIDPQES